MTTQIAKGLARNPWLPPTLSLPNICPLTVQHLPVQRSFFVPILFVLFPVPFPLLSPSLGHLKGPSKQVSPRMSQPCVFVLHIAHSAGKLAYNAAVAAQNRPDIGRSLRVKVAQQVGEDLQFFGLVVTNTANVVHVTVGVDAEV